MLFHKSNQTGQVSFRPPEAEMVPAQIKDLLVFIERPQNKDSGTEKNRGAYR